MSTTLTIRNLDKGVKQKLREQAARNRRSMEAEARDLLARALEQGGVIPPPRNAAEMRERLEAVRGIWKDRYGSKSTEEWMKEIRGDD
jgi:plasmid stability protein